MAYIDSGDLRIELYWGFWEDGFT